MPQIRRGWGKRAAIPILLLSLAALIPLCSEAPKERTFTAAAYGPKWPFLPQSVTITCIQQSYRTDYSRSHVLLRHEGRLHALNGAARGWGRYADALDLVHKNADGILIHDVGPFIEAGLKLGDCAGHDGPTLPPLR